MQDDVRGARQSLPERVAADVRARLLAGEWGDRERLPTEAALGGDYGVSRATVRTALAKLEGEGLVHTRHGVGTFVSSFGPVVRAGLQDLRSMTETIREQGRQPGMRYHRRVRRPASVEEADRLAIGVGQDVIALERAIESDGDVVAFSYDCVRLDGLGDLEPAAFTGSVFAVLEGRGVYADRAVAELHAVRSSRVGWDPLRPPSPLYLLLDQLHYAGETPVAYSRTYFIEGRFQFTIVRRR